MSFFSNLFYGGVTIFVGYELYECYKTEGELNMVTIPKCFFEGLFGDVADEASDTWDWIKDKLPKPDVRPADQDKLLAIEIEGHPGVYNWYGANDVAVSESYDKLREYNPDWEIADLDKEWADDARAFSDADFHRRYGGSVDISDPSHQHHDFVNHPYYQSTPKKIEDKDKDKDKGKHKEGFFDKIFKPTHWF